MIDDHNLRETVVAGSEKLAVMTLGWGTVIQIVRASVVGTALATGALANEVELIGQNTVRIVGTITEFTEEEFRRFLDHGDIQTVELDSDGGQVYAALGVSNRIHAKGINTWIRPSAKCYSACALIFLAGKLRLADGALGVHQIRSDEQDNSLTQAVVADIFSSLSSYGTPDELVAVMLRTPPEDMYVFTPEEIESFGITRSQCEFELSHLQVVKSTLHRDWVVGTFLNTSMLWRAGNLIRCSASSTTREGITRSAN